MSRACSTSEKSNAYRILVGKPEGKRLRRRWVDSVKMDLREMGCGGMDRVDLAQDRDQWRALVNTVMNHKILGSSSVAAQLAASQEVLSSMKLVSYCKTLHVVTRTGSVASGVSQCMFPLADAPNSFGIHAVV
jgi:hypothetical protein